MSNIYYTSEKSFFTQLQKKEIILLDKCFFVNPRDSYNSHMIYLYQDNTEIKAILIVGASKNEIKLNQEMFYFYLKQCMKAESGNTVETISNLTHLYETFLAYEEKVQLEKNIHNLSTSNKKNKL